MPVQIEIDDKALDGFTDPAKQRLQRAATDYVSDLIDEANRIEANTNRAKGIPEVTHSMVDEASISLSRGLLRPKPRQGIRILRVLAAVLTLLVGLMYDPTSLQDKIYMMLFVIVVATAIIAVTVSTLKE